MRLIFLFVLLLVPNLQGKTDYPDLLGTWQFYKMIYRGEWQDPLNPELLMTFEFSETGLSELHYTRKDQEGFCNRLALWFFDPSKRWLYQRVTWVNPQNRMDCSQDPDMQMNQESWTPAQVVNGELHLELPLGDEEIIFVWKRISRDGARIPH